MRRLIALLLFAVSTNACAMTCIVPPVEDRFRDHKHVMLVEVVEARIEQSTSYSPDIPGVEPEVVVTGSLQPNEPIWSRIVATVRVIETYKGKNPPTVLTLTTWGARPAITVGNAMYLVITDGPDISLDCDGMPTISRFDPEHLKLLETLRALRQ